MTVAELRSKLAEYADNLDVVVRDDESGVFYDLSELSIATDRRIDPADARKQIKVRVVALT